jgi:hypothetical protein
MYLSDPPAAVRQSPATYNNRQEINAQDDREMALPHGSVSIKMQSHVQK